MLPVHPCFLLPPLCSMLLVQEDSGRQVEMEYSDPQAKEAVLSGMRVEATGRYRPRGEGDNRRIFTAFNLLTSGGPRPQATMRVPSESVRGVCCPCSWWAAGVSEAAPFDCALAPFPPCQFAFGCVTACACHQAGPQHAHTATTLASPNPAPLWLSAACLQSRHVQAWSAPLQSAQMPCPPSLSMH